MAISDDLKILDELIKNPNVRAGGSARYKNKSYTLAQLVAERNKVSKQLEKQETAQARSTRKRSNLHKQNAKHKKKKPE